jgi:hypothetical protein
MYNFALDRGLRYGLGRFDNTTDLKSRTEGTQLPGRIGGQDWGGRGCGDSQHLRGTIGIKIERWGEFASE